MFGLLSGRRCDKTYRQIYAGCCSTLFSTYGRSSALFHSYEAVFLYCLAVDANWVAPPETIQPTCCRLWRSFAFDERQRKVAEYCNAFGLVLLAIKLKDDILDSRSSLARLGSRYFRKPVKTAYDYFRRIDSDFDRRVNAALADHMALERSGCPSSLEEFQRATSSGFGYIFRLFESVFSTCPKTDHGFSQIGQHLGSAIIAFDCAADWQEDQDKNQYNPLRQQEERAFAIDDAMKHLQAAMSLCPRGDDSNGIASGVLAYQVERMKVRSSRYAQSNLLSRQNKKLRLRYGVCDCPAPDCACDGLDCASCDGVSSPTCCDFCSCDPSCCWNEPKQKKERNEAEPSSRSN